MQPLYGVDLFVDLALFGQAIQRLDRARLDRGESVQLKGLAQPVEHELFDDPGFRDVLRKTGQRLRATHATPCCQPAAARPEGCQAGRGAAGGGSSARSCKYGLPTRSRAIVVCGPCPGSTPTVSGNGSTFVRRLFSMSARFPPGKSVLPIEPAKRTSPLKSTESMAAFASYGAWNMVEPGV